MAATSVITFIQAPHPFIVDFSQYKKKALPPPPPQSMSILERTEAIASGALKLVMTFFVSMGRSAYITLSQSGASFKYIVFSNFESFTYFHLNIYLVVFKIFFWMGFLGLTLITTALRLTHEQFHDKEAEQELLRQYASPQIDVSHIRTKNFEIDVSHVSQDMTVNFLLNMFDGVNLDAPAQPGYMPLLARQEGETIYSKDQLREGLKTFIDRVNGKVPFVGTPPAYDIPQLTAFYQQIENAVRFSMDKVCKDLSEFRRSTQQRPIAQYSAQELSQYKNLLELLC